MTMGASECSLHMSQAWRVDVESTPNNNSLAAILRTGASMDESSLTVNLQSPKLKLQYQACKHLTVPVTKVTCVPCRWLWSCMADVQKQSMLC